MKLLHMLSVAAMLTLSLGAQSANYKEGVHYTEISEVQSVSREVREYLSLLCPHCYTLEKRLPEITLPSGQTLARTHVDFLRGTAPELQTALTRGFVAAKQKGIGDDYLQLWFARIHDQSKPPTSEKDILDSLASLGIPDDTVSEHYNSMSVRSETQAMQSDQEHQVENNIIRGVPSLIVNRRYLIHLHELNRKDFNGDLEKIISYLDSKE